jgi:hypothetical protein
LKNNKLQQLKVQMEQMEQVFVLQEKNLLQYFVTVYFPCILLSVNHLRNCALLTVPERSMMEQMMERKVQVKVLKV